MLTSRERAEANRIARKLALGLIRGPDRDAAKRRFHQDPKRSAREKSKLTCPDPKVREDELAKRWDEKYVDDTPDHEHWRDYNCRQSTRRQHRIDVQRGIEEA